MANVRILSHQAPALIKTALCVSTLFMSSCSMILTSTEPSRIISVDNFSLQGASVNDFSDTANPVISGQSLYAFDGATVDVYTDATCSQSIASAQINNGSFATSNIEFTASQRGLKKFYLTITESNNTTSECIDTTLGYFFDPTEENAWAVHDQIIQNTAQASAAVLGDYTYIYGGSSSDGMSLVTKMYKIENSKLDKFEYTEIFPPTTPTARIGAVMIGYRNKLYLFGGNYTNQLWAYDPEDGADGNWRMLNPAGVVPTVSSFSNIAVLNDALYIKNGWCNSSVCVHNKLYKYNPDLGADGTWSEISDAGWVGTGYYASASVVIDGKWYVYGGYNGSNFDTKVRYYDINVGANGTWFDVTPSSGDAPSGRRYHAFGAVGKSFYIYDGDHSSQNDLWSFNTETETWTKHDNLTLPPRRYQRANWSYGDKIYFFGGRSSGSQAHTDYLILDPSKLNDEPQKALTRTKHYFKSYAFGHQNKLYTLNHYELEEVYENDVLTNTWRVIEAANAPPYVFDTFVTNIENKIYFLSGTSAPNLNQVWLLDLSASSPTWTKVFESSTPGAYPEMIYPTVATSGGKIYVLGGTNEDFTDVVSETWSFDTATNDWIKLNPSGAQPAIFDIKSVQNKGKFLLYGGYDSSSWLPTNETWMFDPLESQDGAWTQLSPLASPGPLYSFTLNVLKDKIHLFGGLNENDVFSNKLYVFDDTAGGDGTWTEITTGGVNPTARSSHSSAVLFDRLFILGGTYSLFHNPKSNTEVLVYRPE